MFSIVIPVYMNEGGIDDLVEALEGIAAKLEDPLEVVFVVDGSPDRSYAKLRDKLPNRRFEAQLTSLSRNFGAFSAIRQGLCQARGDHVAVMAADLQEPPSLVVEILGVLARDEADVAVATRTSRSDPLSKRLQSAVFWWFYRRFVQPDIPDGGVDVFGINRRFAAQLTSLPESNSTLIGQLFWIGGRRREIEYRREERKHGKSAWSFRKKWKYMTDSVFSFSDLPIRVMSFLGSVGIVFSILFGVVVAVARLSGDIPVPGYAGTVVVIAFFAALNLLGLGIIGSYVWRAFENTKTRPHTIVATHDVFEAAP